jgi:hypothetical protein
MKAAFSRSAQPCHGRPFPAAGAVMLFLVLAAACSTATPVVTAPATGSQTTERSAIGSATGVDQSTADGPSPATTGSATSGSSASAGTPPAPAGTRPSGQSTGKPRSTTDSAPPTGRPATTAATSLAPRTTAVPPPGGLGNVAVTVPSRSVTTDPAVPITAPATFGSRISARILSAESITAQAHGPGEISGPGVALTIRISNESSHAVDLGSVTVNVTGSNGSPGLQLLGPPATPFAGSLAAGRTAQAVYVFTIPVPQRSPMTVSISYSAAAPVLVFRGNPT